MRILRLVVGLLLVAGTSACLVVPTPPSGPMQPASLAIYYSPTPWAADQCIRLSDVHCGAAVLSRFQDVVLAAGLEEPDQPLHYPVTQLVSSIHARNPATRVWGYVSAQGGTVDADYHRLTVYSVADVAARAAHWKATGANGVFLDELTRCPTSWSACSTGPGGRPITMTCDRLHQLIEAVHAQGMAVFANGSSPDDLAGTCEGTPSALAPAASGRPADMLLVENPTVVAGRLTTGPEGRAGAERLSRAGQLARGRGIGLAVVDTDRGPVLSDPNASNLERIGWTAAMAAGATAYGFTNPLYSAPADSASDLALPGPDGVHRP